MTKRKRRATPDPAPSRNNTSPPHSTPDLDVLDFDERVIQQVDWSIWRALRQGRFRLAVKCGRCQRWIHNPDSKRAHRAGRCTASDRPNLAGEDS